MEPLQMPFVILFLILSVTLIYVFIQGSEPSADNPVPNSIICTDNQTRACTKDSCNGLQTCINGKWSSCNWEIICDPGGHAPCSIGMCGDSYKVCNDCGNGYENCISGKEG